MKLTELDIINKYTPVIVNDAPYVGKISVGDTIEINDFIYSVVGINEDAIVVKELLGLNRVKLKKRNNFS